jgi:hypothetical protein
MCIFPVSPVRCFFTDIDGSTVIDPIVGRLIGWAAKTGSGGEENKSP